MSESDGRVQRRLLPSAQKAGPGEAGASSLPPPTRKITSACSACQRRKSKCNGQQPCERCRRYKTPCEYHVEDDGRRQRRHLTSSVDPRGETRELLDVIRNTDLSFASIVEAASTGPAGFSASNSDVHHEGIDAFETSNVAEGVTTTNVGDSYASAVGSVVRMRPILVPAQPWTQVADDDTVSHLVSLYFYREQPSNYIIAPGPIITEMRAGDASLALYCSPLLVNCMCALACLLGPRKTPKGAIARESHLVDKFINEAEWWLEQSNGDSLPTCVGLVMLYLYKLARDDENGALPHLQQAFNMADRLDLNCSNSRAGGEGSQPTAAELRVLSKAAWGMFIISVVTAQFYGHAPSVAPPTIERHFADSQEQLKDELTFWVPYPLIREPSECFTSSTMNALCDLSLVCYDICVRNYEQHDSEAQFKLDAYRRIQNWERGLPPELRTLATPLPHVHVLNGFVTQTVIGLFFDAENLDEAFTYNGFGTSKEICLRHCQSHVASLRKIHRNDSMDYLPCLAGTGLCQTALILIPILKYDKKALMALVQACQALQAMSSRYPLFTRVLRGIKALANRHNVDLALVINSCFPPAVFPQLQSGTGGGPVNFIVPGTRTKSTLSMSDFIEDEFIEGTPSESLAESDGHHQETLESLLRKYGEDVVGLHFDESDSNTQASWMEE